MPMSDKIGVCIQPDTTGPLANTAQVDAAMKQMRLNTFRIRAPMVGSDSWRRIYQPLAALGYRFLFTHAKDRDVDAEIADLVAFDQAYPGLFVGLEGPNECDLNPVTFNGITDPRLGVRETPPRGDAALAMVHAQYDKLRAIWPWQKVDMVSFNDFMQPEQYPYTGFANSHIYPGAALLKGSKLAWFDSLTVKHGRKVGYITEFGRHNVVGSTAVGGGVSEADAATLMSQDLPAVMADAKVKRLFLFSLVDYDTSSPNVECRFGLFRSDWTAKPVASAIAQLAG